jgi:hypothetical protein
VLDELLIDFGQLRTVVYGLLVIALFLGFKRGAVPAVTDFLRRPFQRIRDRGRGGGDDPRGASDEP